MRTRFARADSGRRRWSAGAAVGPPRFLAVARRSERGVLLVVVLGLVVLLSLIGYTMSFSVRVHSRIADNSVREAQARYLAAAAVEQSTAILLLDETVVDGPEDPWLDPTFFEPLELGEGTYEASYPDPTAETGLAYGLQDESAKLNLNTATREQLLLLPNMTDSMADALIDWRDADDIPGTFGAESDYYSALDDPYEAKNANLTSLRELLLIRGFDETVVYGEDTNGNGQLDPNEDDGDASPPNDDADGVLDEGLLPYATVFSADRNIQNTGKPRVNIQSASAEELMGALAGLSRQEADAIVNYRNGHSFQSIADLLNVTPSGQEAKKSRSLGSSRQSIDRGGARQTSPSVGSSGQAIGTRKQSNLASRSPRSGGGSSNQAPADESSGQASSESSSKGSSSSGSQPLFTTARLRQWADAITVTDEPVLPGLINLNTASPEVLATLPGLSEDDVMQIGLLRSAGVAPFQTVGDLFNLPGMSESKFREVVDKVTTRSFQFTVHAKGKLASGRAQKEIEAVLERDENGVHALYWR